MSGLSPPPPPPLPPTGEISDGPAGDLFCWTINALLLMALMVEEARWRAAVEGGVSVCVFALQARGCHVTLLWQSFALKLQVERLHEKKLMKIEWKFRI